MAEAPGADDGDPLPGQVDRRGPTGPSGRARPGRCRCPRSPGSFGAERPPAPTDDACGRTQVPAEVRTVQRCSSSSHLAPSTVVSKTKRSRVPDRSRDLLEVGLDLRLRGVRRRPVGVARERERVELARHVAGGAGVGVVAPRAADVGAALDDDEVALAVLLELDGGAQAGEPGPDDQVVDAVVDAALDAGHFAHGGDGIGDIEQVSIRCRDVTHDHTHAADPRRSAASSCSTSASALLATRSLDELSIDLLAEEAGISRGLLYHYFGNKHGVPRGRRPARRRRPDRPDRAAARAASRWTGCWPRWRRTSTTSWPTSRATSRWSSGAAGGNETLRRDLRGRPRRPRPTGSSPSRFFRETPRAT